MTVYPYNPRDPKGDFEDDGASFRVRRNHFLNQLIQIEQARRRATPQRSFAFQLLRWTILPMIFLTGAYLSYGILGTAFLLIRDHFIR